MFSRLRFPPLSFLILLVGLVSACSGEKTREAEVKTVDDRFPIKIGPMIVKMQIAATPEEQQKGLMFRQAMAEDEGMLFTFRSAKAQAFYMRNTVLPLDIGYFDAGGELKEIYPMYPHDERTVPSRSRSIQFCLEMNQGWFSRNAVKPGDKIDLKAVAAAITARGFKPDIEGF